MRIDKYINAVNITKRRTIAQDMIASSVVFLNGVRAKASREVKVGDRVEIRYLEYTKEYEVLQIPTTKSTPKAQQSQYIKEIA